MRPGHLGRLDKTRKNRDENVEMDNGKQDWDQDRRNRSKSRNGKHKSEINETEVVTTRREKDRGICYENMEGIEN